MMAARSDVFRFALFVLILLCYIAKRKLVKEGNGIFPTEDFLEKKDNYASSSLWITRKKISTKAGKHLFILILLSGDIETQPGPFLPELKNLLSKRGIKIFHLNVRGLLNNIDQIGILLHDFKDIDILTLSEIHITKDSYNDNPDLYHIPGYSFIYRARKKGKCGGVAMYISDRVKWKHRTNLEHNELESLWVEIFQKNAKSFLVGTMYRPPVGSKYLPREFKTHLNDLLQLVMSESKEVNLLGDLNINFLKKSDDKDIKELLRLYGLKQLIEKPTRITDNTQTLIDCILTTRNDTTYQNDVIPIGISDHDMVGFVRKLRRDKLPPKIIKTRNYAKYSSEQMVDEISKHNWGELYGMNDVNIAWSYFKTTLTALFNKHAPIIGKTVKGQFCPWLNNGIYKLMNERDKALRKARKSKKPSDWKAYCKVRNLCTRKIRESKSQFSKNLLAQNCHNPKKFWDTIKKIMPTKPRNVVSDATATKSKVESLCLFFSSIAAQIKEKSIPLKDFVWKQPQWSKLRTTSIFTFKYVSKISIEKELKKLKRSKATGVDDLPPGLLKDCSSQIAAPLCHIINLSIQTAMIPGEWKHAVVKPIFKKGSTDDNNNYRPISILPVISKILERAVYDQVIEYLEKNNLLSQYQFGYRRLRSTDLAANLLLDDIRKEVDKKKYVAAVFMDLSKAFDTVGHSILIEKLSAYGIRGNELEWFSDYLFGRKQEVVVNNIKSDPQPVNCGVPQGSILGPLLFLIFFNDFDNVLLKASVIKFADDTVIYFSSESFLVLENVLNEELLAVETYLRENDLVINLNKGKTEWMIFGTSKMLKSAEGKISLSCNFVEINETKSYKYLGSIIDPKLSLNNNFDSTYKKASGRLRLLTRLRSEVDDTTAKKIYETMITPIITFNSIINLNLNNTQLNKLQSLDRRARVVTNNNSLQPIYDKIQRNACNVVRKCIDRKTCSNYWNHFQLLNHQRLTRNNFYSLKLPAVRLDMARNGFYYMGASIYNSLPIDIRREPSYMKFKNKLDNHIF